MKKHLRLSLLFIIVFFSISSCKKWFKDEELTLPKQPYAGSELRTDGYYYYTMDGEYFRTITFFYKNGVVFRPPSGFHSLQEVDEYVINELVGENRFHDNQLSWELFNIENDRILFNYWVSPRPYQCYFLKGTILNDTTFVEQRYYRMEDGEVTDEGNLNETFHFRQFSPKPDSTNIFIQ